MATLHIKIEGKVQGVFFRATARKVAEGFSITGKVRNTEDGSVEVWATGPEAQLDRFLAWCRKGPEGARVEAVHAEDAGNLHFEGFEIDRG